MATFERKYLNLQNFQAHVMKVRLSVVILSLTMWPFIANCQETSPLVRKNKTLIVFFDGLRPDYITPEQMPNLYAFQQKASVGLHHHSVFPTVTRVNSASYATGSYPGTHGILGNTVYFPQVDKNRGIGTTYGDFTRIAEALSGPLVTAVSMGEVLQSAGERMMVFSSGTTGQAFLQNHTVGEGAIVNPGLVLPESFRSQVLADLGEVSKIGSEDQNRHAWITDAFLKYGLASNGPLVSAIWYSDPDGAAHEHGIGSPEAVAAIKFVDAQFGRILQAMADQKLADRFNIIISADHGFVTHEKTQSLTDFLIAEGLKKDRESDDVVVAEGAIYVKNHQSERIEEIVAALHRNEKIGAVFTKPKTKGDPLGWVPGTLSFEVIHYNHPERSGDILVATNWNDARNAYGYAGTDFAGGVAGHGGSSPYEINIRLLASGPDFKESYQGQLPTSNVDIAPTILSLYQLPIPESMNGRVIKEFLKKEGKTDANSTKNIIETEVKYPWGAYLLSAEISVLGQYRYFDFSKTERKYAR